MYAVCFLERVPYGLRETVYSDLDVTYLEVALAEGEEKRVVTVLRSAAMKLTGKLGKTVVKTF